jgi:hypothetical protein
LAENAVFLFPRAMSQATAGNAGFVWHVLWVWQYSATLLRCKSKTPSACCGVFGLTNKSKKGKGTWKKEEQ